MTERIKTEYYINEEKRTIVCVITATNDIFRRLAKYGLEDYYCDKKNTYIYKGVAKCAPEDTWNVEYGKKLAEYRAACARKSHVNKELAYYANKIYKKVSHLCAYGLMKDSHEPKFEDFKEKKNE